MTKTEKLIVALVLMALGVLFILLKDSFIGILMTVVGVSLIALGGVDIFNRRLPLAIVKIIAGLLLIICGWLIVEAVLYILAGVLLIVGVLALYDRIKNKAWCASVWQVLLDFATPLICVAIGVLLLFQSGIGVELALIFSGVLMIVEGIAVLVDAFIEE